MFLNVQSYLRSRFSYRKSSGWSVNDLNSRFNWSKMIFVEDHNPVSTFRQPQPPVYFHTGGESGTKDKIEDHEEGDDHF